MRNGAREKEGMSVKEEGREGGRAERRENNKLKRVGGRRETKDVRGEGEREKQVEWKEKEKESEGF